MGQLLFTFKSRLCSCNIPSSGHAMGQLLFLLTGLWSCNGTVSLAIDRNLVMHWTRNLHAEF
jgi:hypothetical protein